MKFIYRDPISIELPTSIKVNNNSNDIDEVIFIRLLSGTIDFTNLDLNLKQIKQRINYFKFTFDRNLRATPGVLTDINQALTNNSIINNYFRSSSNRTFFNELKHELSCFFYYQNNKFYTTAFIHLYRILEYMSFSFPLLYTSLSNDFKTSFQNLKELFKENSNGSELNFHSLFFKQLFDTNDPLIPYNNSVNIDFSILGSNDFINIKTAFDNIIQSEKKLQKALNSGDININISSQIITIKFNLMHTLIIVIRNRFFHYSLSHPNNISSTYFVSEFFFEIFNDYTLNWIAYIFGEILEYRISKI